MVGLRKEKGKMNVKFGANTLIWVLSFTEKDFPLLDKVAGMGFDAVEITPGAEFRKLDPGKLRKKLDDLGLEVSMCGGLDAEQDYSSDDGPSGLRRWVHTSSVALSTRSSVKNAISLLRSARQSGTALQSL